jgi:hypothetical protein
MHLVPPAELELVDGRLMFLAEDEGIYLCATLADDVPGDAPVWGARDSRRWMLESEPVGRFLLQWAVDEAVLSSETGWGYLRASCDEFHRCRAAGGGGAMALAR